MSPALNISSTVRLRSGYTMPRLGFGVYQTPADICKPVVLHALRTGYRHIDSATVYRNERPCAQAIAASGTPRSEIFFTTKLPPRLRGYAATVEAIQGVLDQNPELEGYIDLYLIHAPYGTREERLGQWKAMVEAAKAGKVRSLGVSNYGVHHLEELKHFGDGGVSMLSVGQWELHPWLPRHDIVSWCEREGVAVQAYAPVVRATRMEDPLIVPLAEKYKKTPAQILLRWSLQMGWIPLPKSVHNERIEENAGVFDFELTGEEVKRLDTGRYEPVCWDPTKEETKG
ncbi:NADP-dependent oxidoreductase domain-containing protein [Sphaerosporella brunnea]|uniref:NADP-dependent oxidoreductase domain-containing protein n=1 Tax=Sphaerosporella brunnea TaxID=1250544 RepID=A0A5J5EJ63_9PEZI|nr:NADP-dependent oxidoreductase domain-containing protein [Sphaerosporella brunnea]